MELRLGKVKEARATCEPFAKDAGAGEAEGPAARPLLPRARLLPRPRLQLGRPVAQPARPVRRPAFGPHARYLVGRVLHLERGERRGVGPLRRCARQLRQGEEGRRPGADAAGQVQERPVREGPARSAGERPAARLRRRGRVPRRLPRLRGRQVRRTRSPSSRRSRRTTRLAAAARRRAAGRALPRADEAVRRGREAAAPARGEDPAARRPGAALARQGAARARALAADPNNPRRPRRQAQGGDRDAQEGRRQGRANSPSKTPTRRPAGTRSSSSSPTPSRRRSSTRMPRPFTSNSGTSRRCRRGGRNCCSGLRHARVGRGSTTSRTSGATSSAGSSRRGCSPRRSRSSRRRTPTPGPSRPEKNKSGETEAAVEEAAGRYKEVADKYPEFERVNYARFGLGVCHAQLGNLEEAVKAFEAIPASDRGRRTRDGGVPARRLPDPRGPGEGRRRAGRERGPREADGRGAVLDGFVSANPKAAEAPAALLKLGHCTKRLGAPLADANETEPDAHPRPRGLRQAGEGVPAVPSRRAGPARTRRK